MYSKSVGKQGRDDSMKQVTIQPPYLPFCHYAIMEKMSVGGLYTELFYYL